MFRNKLCESRQKVVTLQDVEAEMFELILDYAYTGGVLITRNNVQALLAAANLLQVCFFFFFFSFSTFLFVDQN
jgi:hypothetical protein